MRDPELIEQGVDFVHIDTAHAARLAVDYLIERGHTRIGMIAGIELAPRAGAPGARAYDAFVDCFEKGLLIRVTGDIIALSPPLIVERAQIDTMVSMLADALARTA